MSKPRATHLDQCAQTCAVTLPGSSSLGQAVLQLEIWLCQPQELAHDVGDDMVREVRERGYIVRDLTATTGARHDVSGYEQTAERLRYGKLRDTKPSYATYQPISFSAANRMASPSCAAITTGAHRPRGNSTATVTVSISAPPPR